MREKIFGMVYREKSEIKNIKMWDVGNLNKQYEKLMVHSIKDPVGFGLKRTCGTSGFRHVVNPQGFGLHRVFYDGEGLARSGEVRDYTTNPVLRYPGFEKFFDDVKREEKDPPMSNTLESSAPNTTPVKTPDVKLSHHDNTEQASQTEMKGKGKKINPKKSTKPVKKMMPPIKQEIKTADIKKGSGFLSSLWRGVKSAGKTLWKDVVAPGMVPLVTQGLKMALTQAPLFIGLGKLSDSEIISLRSTKHVDKVLGKLKKDKNLAKFIHEHHNEPIKVIKRLIKETKN